MAYSGETVTYGQLEARSNQGAHLFRSLGRPMLYSSGTTGRPKGVKRIAPTGAVDNSIEAANPLATLGAALYGWTPDSIYLSPAPLYHAAPLGWSTAVQAMGGTVILMERF